MQLLAVLALARGPLDFEWSLFNLAGAGGARTLEQSVHAYLVLYDNVHVVLHVLQKLIVQCRFERLKGVLESIRQVRLRLLYLHQLPRH